MSQVLPSPAPLRAEILPFPRSLEITDLHDKEIFVAWQAEPNTDPNKSAIKVPYCGQFNRASSTNPADWRTYQTAQVIFNKLTKPLETGGVGIVLGRLDQNLRVFGIDFDTILDPLTNDIHPSIKTICDKLNSYTEISPSRTGLKLLGLIAEKDWPKIQESINGSSGKAFKQHGDGQHPPGIEFYGADRYFTLTDDFLANIAKRPLRLIEADQIIEVLKVDGPAFVAQDPPQPRDYQQGATSGYTYTGTEDNSRSGRVYQLMKRMLLLEKTEAQIREAIEADEVLNTWLIEKGDARNGREFRNLYQYAFANTRKALFEAYQARLNALPTEDLFDALERHPEGSMGQNDATTKRGKIPLLTIDDLFLLPPTEWLINNLLPERSLSVTYGRPKGGKTFFVLSMALHVAAGKDWFGHTTKQGPVVYIAGEGHGGLHTRIAAMLKTYELESKIPFYVIPQAINFHSKDAVQELLDLVRSVEVNPALIVVDTLSRAMAGVDENSTQEVGIVISHCDQLKAAMKCCVMPIHHTGKDATRGMRGSTVILGAVDATFLIDSEGQTLTMHNVDQKEAEPHDPMSFNMEKVFIDEKRSSLVPQLIAYTPDASTSSNPAGEDLMVQALRNALRGNLTCSSKDWSEAYSKLRNELKPDALRQAFSRSKKKVLATGEVVITPTGDYALGEPPDEFAALAGSKETIEDAISL